MAIGITAPLFLVQTTLAPPTLLPLITSPILSTWFREDSRKGSAAPAEKQHGDEVIEIGEHEKEADGARFDCNGTLLTMLRPAIIEQVNCPAADTILVHLNGLDSDHV